MLAAIPGLEVTSEVWTEVAPRSIGHANTFPFKVEPRAFRGGAVANEGRRWRDVIAELRARPGERIVQLNHPRRGDGSEDPRAFLSHLGRGTPYDPSRRLDEEPNRGAILLGRAGRLRHRLQEEGLDTMASESQIIPIRIGSTSA